MKNLQELIVRPSFNLLMIQGWVFFVMLLTVVLLTFLLSLHSEVDIFFLQTLPLGFIMGMCPILVFCSFVEFLILLKLDKHGVNSYLAVFIITLLATTVIFLPYYFMGLQGAPGLGMGFVFLLFWGIIAGGMSVILFSLCPFLIFLHKENRLKMNLLTPSLSKSRFLLYCILFGTTLYLIYVILNLIFLISWIIS